MYVLVFSVLHTADMAKLAQPYLSEESAHARYSRLI